MKKTNSNTLITLLVAVVISPTTSVNAQRGNGGWGQNSNYGKIFNPKTIETLTGSIVAVERIVPVAKMFYGLHLKVKTGTETISAHLAPTCYLDNQEIQFSKGDKIMVEGSRVSFQNVPAIIATEVEKNDDVLKLRDTNGYPVWSGWRKKGMGKRRNIN